MQKYKILLVDDDPNVLEVLNDLFCDDYITLIASTGEDSIKLIKNDPDITVVVMDIKMPVMDGISTGRAIKQINSSIPIIFHTGYPGDYDEDKIDRDEQPFDYIQKGNSSTRLIRSVNNAVESYTTKQNQFDIIDDAEKLYGLIGKSKPMLEIYELIKKVSASDTKVMILGETGTGKELVAKAIHNNSKRKKNRLGILNCNHKAPDIVESELFGHTKGAFTGAIFDSIGLFEYADKGTVFLDEIGDLDITTQAKLLRILETGEYQKIGSPQIKNTDVRIICATHKNLKQMVVDEKFREDLFFRLKGITLNLPALRDKKEDIPLLVDKFKDQLTIEKGLHPKIIDNSAINTLLEYDWPGNVRQLYDTIESIVVLADSDLIVKEDIEDYLEINYTDTDPLNNQLSSRLKELEKTLILEALVETNCIISAAATLLGVERSNLSKKIKNYNIDIQLLSKSN